MYNGIGILSVRGSGTSGYVQGNKFNLRGGRPVQNRLFDNTQDTGPTQRQPDESILLHNHKREIELKLLAEADKLGDQGLAEEEIDSKVAALRLQLESANQVAAATEQGNADETHAAAKRQLEKMVKLRTVFGLPQNQDSKEGEAFDRELQEKRKQARIEQRELAEATKVKQARALKKEAKRREKDRVRAAKKAEKDARKQEKQRQKEHLQRQQQREQERVQAREEALRAAERARAIREAPAPERYVPRGASPSRYEYSSDSEDLPLPSLPPARTSRRIASQIASRPAEAPAAAAARPSRRSRSLSPDPVRTAVTHAEPPRHTTVPSPPGRVRPDRSPSPPPKRQRREDSGTEHRQSSHPVRDDYRTRDDYRSRNGSRTDAYQSSRHGTERDSRRDAAAVYGDMQGRSSRAENGRRGDRDRDSRDVPRGPYGDRERTRGSDRDARDDRDYHRSHHEGGRREDRPHRHTDKRSASPAVRAKDVRQEDPVRKGSKQRRASPSSSSDSGSSSSSGSGSSTSGSSGSGSSGSSSSGTSSSGRSR